MGRGFDGLVVEALYDRGRMLMEIEKVSNDNIIFGDREVTYPVPRAALYISDEFLEEIEDEGNREYSHKNPFGKMLFEGRYAKDKIEVTFVEYENTLSVTVLEKVNDSVKTLYSQNFFSDSELIKEIIQVQLAEGDLDDLVFKLKEAKENE